jgi:hypothetical protein
MADSNGMPSNAKFVVLPIEAVRMLNIRTPEQVEAAQGTVSDDMIKALEEMVSAAKSNKLRGSSALALGAIKW